ncbi:MAG: glutamyl-tRNA amidotransferase [Leptolyngbyaceae cyanobacterium]
MTETLKLAVNGTLMRGLALNPNLTNVGATFDCETTTEPAYRLWTISDRYPAMMRVAAGGAAIAVEIWNVPLAGLGAILMQEPPGLAIGKVKLANGETVLGVIGEPLTVKGQREITQFGGWRAYQASLD